MKKEIIQISLEQFLKHGIRKMSVQKLVAPLGISTKTVYKHFENKEDLLKQALLFYYDRQYQALEEQAKNLSVVFLLCNIWYGAIDAELKVNQAFFRDLLYYYPELNEKFTAITADKFLKPLIRIIQRGIDEGILEGDIIPEIALDGMVLLYTTIIRKEQFKKFNLTPLDLLSNTMLVYVKGLCTRNGLEECNEHIKALQQFETYT